MAAPHVLTDADIAAHDSQSRTLTDADIAAHDSKPEDHRGVLKQYWDRINPVTMAQGVAEGVRHPIDAAVSYGAQTKELGDKAIESFKKGEYAEGVRHGLSYFLNAIPGVGKLLDEAGNKAGSGDYKGAIADTAALATMIAGGKVAPRVLDAATEPGAVSGVASAVAKVPGKVVDIGKSAAASPVVRDMVGVLSPRAGRALDLVSKVRKAVDSAEATPAAPTPTPAGPKLVLGESPPASRPEWRQEVVDYLNQLEEHLKAPDEPVTPQAIPQAAPVEPVIAKPSNVIEMPSSPVPEAYRSTEDTGLQIPQEAMARDAVKNKILTHLREAGITNEHLDRLDANPAARDMFWDHIGHLEGIYKDPHAVSPKTIAAVRGELERPNQPSAEVKPAVTEVISDVLRNPSARRLAEALRDELLKSEPSSAPKLMEEVGKPRSRRKRE